MSRRLLSQFISLVLPASYLFPHPVAANGVTLFPEQQLYPVNLADPRRIQFAAKSLYFKKTSIDQTGDRRFDLKLGGRLGLLHLSDSDAVDASERGWLLSLDAGFHGQFDVDASQDNLGWDGHYALMLSYRPSSQLVFKIGAYHISSHVGDEYIERTGRTRINYTREELQAGMNLALDNHWQWYVEAGHAYDQRNTRLQEAWRGQTGLQYQSGIERGMSWYAGLDIGASEERDWQKDLSVQLGWQIPRAARVWRIGLEVYDGKAQLGEFFQDDERYIGIGLWLDI